MCAGQVLGVRMGMLGLNLLGFTAPLDDRNIKKVIVFIEIDRCAADALATVTGVKLGRRSLKFKDYGLMAATFIRLTDGRAYRVSVREDCRSKAEELFPDVPDIVAREIEAYQILPAEALFQVDEVQVDLKEEDLPGWHGEKAICDQCGSMIRHRRYIRSGNRILCQVCGGDPYFQKLSSIEHINELDPVMKKIDKG